MTSGLPKPFPELASIDRDDRNPAIRLFGKRFINEQSPLELLAEFLAVAFCEKRIDGVGPIDGTLPSPEQMSSWPHDKPLQYRPPVKLNLKLFALLGASRIDSRHPVHLQHYKVLTRRLQEAIRTRDGKDGETIEWLEELLRGFQGAGFNRTWCAQTFLPVSKELLTQETLWNETEARRAQPTDWHETVNEFHRYYSVSKHRFLARGGELMYLQLCNALSVSRATIQEFAAELGDPGKPYLSEQETDPKALLTRLRRHLRNLYRQDTELFDRLIGKIEDLDLETRSAVNPQHNGDGWLSCEWCPQESWRESYLFAIELDRLVGTSLAPMEQLETLVLGFALQVLRSLCAQSARYGSAKRDEGPLGYTWVITPPDGAPKPLKITAQRNLQALQGLIQGALRTEALQRNARGGRIPVESLYREADTKYGHKLLLSLGKKLGLIVPKTGPGARFIMTDDLLRYLVLALLRPGERCTYDTFLKRLYLHYGIAIEGEYLARAASWSGLPANRSIQPGDGGWLTEALRAGGFLTELSDACSVVRNPYAPADDPQAGGAQ